MRSPTQDLLVGPNCRDFCNTCNPKLPWCLLCPQRWVTWLWPQLIFNMCSDVRKQAPWLTSLNFRTMQQWSYPEIRRKEGRTDGRKNGGKDRRHGGREGRREKGDRGRRERERSRTAPCCPPAPWDFHPGQTKTNTLAEEPALAFKSCLLGPDRCLAMWWGNSFNSLSLGFVFSKLVNIMAYTPKHYQEN